MILFCLASFGQDKVTASSLMWPFLPSPSPSKTLLKPLLLRRYQRSMLTLVLYCRGKTADWTLHFDKFEIVGALIVARYLKA